MLRLLKEKIPLDEPKYEKYNDLRKENMFKAVVQARTLLLFATPR
jgi:hypothetical protein